MIFLVRIRVLPKLLQTCRVFLSFFQGQKIHQVRYVCPKKTVYLLKKYWLGELNPPSFCGCSKFHGVFCGKKLKNYERKNTTRQGAVVQSECLLSMEDFLHKRTIWESNDLKQASKTCSCHVYVFQLEHPCHNYRNCKKSQSLIQ